MSAPRAIGFYYRDGCHLCEEMAADIHAGWPQVMQEMHWINVDSTPEIRQRFGMKVPVLTCDDEVVCEFRLTTETMSLYFGKRAVPV